MLVSHKASRKTESKTSESFLLRNGIEFTSCYLKLWKNMNVSQKIGHINVICNFSSCLFGTSLWLWTIIFYKNKSYVVSNFFMIVSLELINDKMQTIFSWNPRSGLAARKCCLQCYLSERLETWSVIKYRWHDITQ